MGIRIEAPKQDGNARFNTLKVNLTENTTTTRGVVVDNDGNFYYGTPSPASGSAFPFTGSAEILGSLVVSGSITATQGITGSLYGTASWALNALTASYVDAANVVGLNLSRITTGSVTASVDTGINAFLITSQSIELFKVNSSGSVIHGSGSVSSGSYQTIVGKFNQSSSVEGAFIIGNGTSDSTRSNLLFAQNNTVGITGSVNITGSTTQIGNNTLLGNTVLSGSIIISGSLGSTPTVRIYGDTTHNGYIRFDPVSTNINSSISASYIYVSGSTNDLYFTQNGDGFSNTTRLRWLEGNLYTGILTGGVVSGSIGGTTFNVSSGSGLIVTMNATTASREPYPSIRYISWPNFTNVTPTYLTTNDTTWLLIDQSSNLIQQTNAPSNGQFDNMIQIGSLVHPNFTNISLYKTFTVTSYAIAQQTYEFIRVFGAIKVSGHTLTPSGSTLGLNRSSGVAYAIGRNYINDANKPSLVTDPSYNGPSIFRYYKSGSVFVTATGTSVIDPTQYNTPTTSTGLSAAPGGLYSIQRVFYFPNQPNILGVYYGREIYNSISTALSNLPYEVFEENSNTLAQAIFAGYIIVKSGTTDLSNTSDAKFVQAGAFRNTTGGGGGGTAVTSLADLSDVGIASPTQGDLLIYNGAEWQNGKVVTSLTGSFLGPLQGTASWAQNAVTASYITASNVYGPFGSNSILSSSYSVSSSYSLTASFATSASFAQTASYITSSRVFGPFGFDSIQTSSFAVSSSRAATSSLALTASFITGSGVFGPFGSNSILSASFASSASFSSQSTSASYSLSSSYAFSSSYSFNATTASFSTQALTASYVLNAISSSQAQTASFVTGSNVFGPFGSNSVLSASYAVSSSYSANAGTITGGTTNYVPLWTSANTLGISVAFQSASNIGISTLNPYQKLTVLGNAELGSLSTNGGPFLYRAYVGSSNNYINVFGSEFSSGNLTLGYGAVGKAAASGYTSTLDLITVHRGILTLGQGTLQFLQTRQAVNTAVGGDLPMTSSFLIDNTGLASFSDGMNISGSLNVSRSITASNALINGTLTVQTIVAQTITSSTDFVTGSTRFGTLLTNTHQFTGSVSMTGSLTAIGRATINDLTGSLFGTASWAQNAVTSSFTVSASYALSSSLAQTASFTVSASFAASASLAQTASFTISSSFATSASFSQTASYVNPLRQIVEITGSLIVTGSAAVTGSLNVTSVASINGSTIYTPSVYSLDINGGVIIKNTGKAANLTIINADPSVGGNNGYVIHSVGGTVGASFAKIQGYYGASTVGDTTIQLNPEGGKVTIGTTSLTGASLLTVNGNISANWVTASLFGTASWAQNAQTASFVTGSSVFGPHGANSVLSSSFAVSASWAPSQGLTGGTTNVVPLWTSPTTLGTSVISQSSNYIGINTSPFTYLHVREAVNTGVEGFYITNWNNTTTVKLGSDTTSGGAKLLLNSNAGTTNVSLTSYANNYISGSLGIGIVSPAYKLDVDGDARIATTLTAVAVTASLFGTSSWSRNTLTASFVTGSNVFGPFGTNSILSSSFAISASFVLTSSLAQTASFVTSSNVRGPHGFNSILSSSYAISSSFATSASFANTATNVSGGTNNRIALWNSATTLSSSLLLQSPGIVTAYGLLASYTEQAGAGTNLFYSQNRDTTAGVTHQTRFGTQQLGGGIARTLLYAAAPDTGDTVGELAIISENGGANIATIGKYTTNVNNTFSLYTTASVETNRIHSNGDSFFNGGNVGIGTASPVAKLHVGGAFISNYLWTDTSGVSYWGTYPSSYGVLTWGSTYAHVYATTGNNLRLGANGSNIHMFISASGNVGVGTTDPQHKLHIAGTSIASTTVTNINQFSGIRLDGSLSSTNRIGIAYQAGGGGGSSILFGRGNSYDTDISFYTNPITTLTAGAMTERMVINSAGNVGINITSPAYKLDVSGSVRMSGSVLITGLTQVAQTNVVTINTSTGQLYYTASSAIGGGGLSGGTTNFVPLWTSATTLGSSVISQSSGNIGIGITPSYKLDIGGSLGIQNKLFAAVVGDYNTIYSQAGNVAMYLGGTVDPANYYYNTTHYFRDIAGATRVTITTATEGRLGINVAPTQVFEAQAANANAKFQSTTGTNPAFFQFVNTGGNFYLGMDNSTGTNFGGTIGYAGVVHHSGAYPIQFFTSATLRMTLTSGGNLGIGAGTSTTSYKLDVNASGATGARIFSGSLAVGNILPNATVGRIDASNDVVAFSTSDIRFKTNLTPIDNALDKITTISGYEFDWIPNQEYHGYKGRDVGVIAQEIETVLPQVVTTRDSGYKAVKYEKIVPLLIQAIKEQQTQIDELRYLLQNKT